MPDRRNLDAGKTPESSNGVQPRPDHSAGGNSEGDTENASIRPFSNTPRVETTPAYGATRRNATPPTPVVPPPRTRTRKQKDQNTPDPMSPTQATAPSADTALSQSEHRGPYPIMVQRREYSQLLGKTQDLDNGETGRQYVTDDDELFSGTHLQAPSYAWLFPAP